MKKKRLLMLIGSVCLALVLAALLLPACAAPAGEEAAKLQEELAAEKAKTEAAESKVSELEEEIAALRKPAEVQRWEPSSWASAGTSWDTLQYMADYITRGSNGRIVVTPSLPGAICPVEGQLDFVAMGGTEAMVPWTGYFAGAIPVLIMEGDCVALMDTPARMRDLYENYEDGKLFKLVQGEYARYGNVVLVKHLYWVGEFVFYSNLPIDSINDINGMMWRATDLVADALTELGAGMVWLPGPEIYTGLATGTVDAAYFSGADIGVAMSFDEVSKYWLRTPKISGGCCDSLIVNSDVWNGLGDDLKAVVEAAVDAGSARNVFEGRMAIDKAWEVVADEGIKIADWSPDDCAKWQETMVSCADKYRTDPACSEFLDILSRYLSEE